MILRHHRSPLFPYTTLFRSRSMTWPHLADREEGEAQEQPGLPGGSSSRDLPRRQKQSHGGDCAALESRRAQDRKSTRLNSSHLGISYAVFCLKKKKRNEEEC